MITEVVEGSCDAVSPKRPALPFASIEYPGLTSGGLFHLFEHVDELRIIMQDLPVRPGLKISVMTQSPDHSCGDMMNGFVRTIFQRHQHRLVISINGRSITPPFRAGIIKELVSLDEILHGCVKLTQAPINMAESLMQRVSLGEASNAIKE